jgi:hypothetical protein
LGHHIDVAWLRPVSAGYRLMHVTYAAYTSHGRARQRATLNRVGAGNTLTAASTVQRSLSSLRVNRQVSAIAAVGELVPVFANVGFMGLC